MNILIFSWRGPGHPNAGGAEISTHEHAKGWVRAGHNVTLFTSSYKGAKREEVVDGVHIIRFGSQILGVHLEAFKWYLWSRHPKYDLVIDQFHGIPFFTPLYVSEKKLAFIHEVTKEVWGLNSWPMPFNLIPALLGGLFESLVFKLFYKKIPFMTVSDSTKKDLTKWEIDQKNITVVHNGFNMPKIKSFEKEKNGTFIFLGALSKDKGIEDALIIFSILNKLKKDYQFWVVGKGESEYLERIKKTAARLDLDNKIKFWGFVGEEKKFELLSKAHILINPSIREGWGLVIIEAAAVRTPAVGYDVVGLKDSIINGRTGILAAPNPDSVAKAALSLLSNKEKYSRISRNAIIWSKEFSWEKAVKMSLRLIVNITG